MRSILHQVTRKAIKQTIYKICVTLPEANIAPAIGGWKMKFPFEMFFLSSNVSSREGKSFPLNEKKRSLKAPPIS